MKTVLPLLLIAAPGGPAVAQTNHIPGNPVVVSGQLGVGTSAPKDKVEVVSTSAGSAVPALRLSNDSMIDNTGVGLEFYTDSTGYVGSSIYGVRVHQAGPEHALVFDVNQAEQMRITSNGDVGIGTDTPSNPLDVNRTAAGSTVFPFRISNTSNNANTGAGMEFYTDSTGYVGSSIVGLRTSQAGPGHSLLFNVNQAERNAGIAWM